MRFFLTCTFLALVATLCAQQKQNPVIKSYGGIYNIRTATVRPDSNMLYKIVVDVKTGGRKKTEPSEGLVNVARMLNLHEIGGAFQDNMEVVLAIHGEATYAVLTDKGHRRLFGVPNPNIDLIRELKVAGVDLTVCGQSLIGRNVRPGEVLREVAIATSMLTTVSTCQMKGFAVFQF